MSGDFPGRQDHEDAYDQVTPPTGVFSPHHDNPPEHEHEHSLGEVSGQSSLDGARKSRGEKARGRGAGKKLKEKKICREHPGKVFIHASDYKKHMNQQHLRPFLCVFYFAGCVQNFGSKNEWKRHVYSQHLQIFYWHCDGPICADRKAIFNRKDLFAQHIKRMHFPSAGSKASVASYMEEMVDRCRIERREPPQDSRCGYCKQTFSGPQSWEQRMEHVGQHYEKSDFSYDSWVRDEGLIAWSLEHGIIEDNGSGGYAIVAPVKNTFATAAVEQRELAEEEMANDCDSADGDHY